ncbi:MAG: hypothetical protein ABJC87_23470, partial [Roseobacter sp.]
KIYMYIYLFFVSDLRACRKASVCDYLSDGFPDTQEYYVQSLNCVELQETGAKERVQEPQIQPKQRT